MNKRALVSLFVVAFLSLLAAPLWAQTGAPKYVSKPGEEYFDFGNEPIRYIENDRVKVGFNLAIGGAVVYLEDKKNNSGNMINSYDWGRQIQLSYYSGPHPFIGPNGEKPSDSWAGLGWNPIQAGDCGGYGSRVLEFKIIGDDQAFVKARPMLWPNIGLLAECVFECRYRLMENGFELEATIINDRSDKTPYLAHGQETPALYTNAPWYKLVSYLGDKPFENESTTTLVDLRDGNGWPWLNYYCPERWSALLNEDNCGVGVFQPKSTRAAAGFAGGDGNKGRPLGEKASPTGYIAPHETIILDWNIKYTYRTTFIVGSLDEIRRTVYALAQKEVKNAPVWEFKDDRQNWTYANTTDEGWDLQGKGLTFNLLPDAAVIAKSPDTFWLTKDTDKIEITGDFAGSDDNPVQNISLIFTPVSPADACWYLQWSEGDKDSAKDRAEKEAANPRLPNFTVDAPLQRADDGKAWTVTVDLTQIKEYKGAMRQLQLVFPPNNGKVNLKSVKFFKSAQ